MDNEDFCEILQGFGMCLSQVVTLIEKTRPRLIPFEDENWAIMELCDPTNYNNDVDYEEDITI